MPRCVIDVHLPLIDEAGKGGIQILGLQEMFNGPYSCPSHWCDMAEPVPGPATHDRRPASDGPMAGQLP